jgi:toxin-antitoxin system PIN domain toxin
MVVIDTNILVHAANRESEFYQRCHQTLETCRQSASPWYVSWGICYEFLRVCTHPGILSKPQSFAAAWHFLNALLISPSAGILLPTPRHGAILAEVIAELPDLRGNILHDAHTAVLMREHGIKQLYTRDHDFHRFPFITVIDPVR